MRFSDKETRDKVHNYLKGLLKSQYEDDDSYVEKHLCYNDEDNPQPCVVEEKINAKDIQVVSSKD